jgi:RNA polymerase sigma-70 factor (ECF subfamily)
VAGVQHADHHRGGVLGHCQDADGGEHEALAAPVESIDLQLDLERAMRRLSPAEQTVLLHCVQLGLSHEEAAYVLAMPLGTVKTHATRGKAKLQNWLSIWQASETKRELS